MFRAAETIPASALTLAEGEASCFQHATKRAVNACSRCGRFICALCTVEFRGTTVCPGCLELVSREGKVGELETHRTLWDSLALGVAIVAGPIYPFWAVTGPAAIFLSIKNWSKPSSLVPRNKWRFILAIVIGTLETGGLVALVVILYYTLQLHR